MRILSKLVAILGIVAALSSCTPDTPIARRWQLSALETTPPIPPDAAQYLRTLYPQAFLDIHTDGTFTSTMDVLGGRSQPFDGKWNLTDGGSKLSLETPASPEPAEYIVEVVDDTRLVLKTDKVRMEFKRAD